jgi:hypothetical protein
MPDIWLAGVNGIQDKPNVFGGNLEPATVIVMMGDSFRQ